MVNPIKILIIDDEAMLRESFKNYFEDEDAFVLEASNGAEGIELCLKERPDLVITDLRMPVMNGFDVIEQLKVVTPEIPIIVVSGQGTTNDVIAAIRLGAWDYITKPILKLEELSIVVQRVLERARLIQDNIAYKNKLEQLLDDNRIYREHLEELVHKRTEQLKEVAAKYQIVADHTYSWEFWINPQGQFVYSSPSCFRITGHTDDEFIANPALLHELVHPDDLADYKCHRHSSQLDQEPGTFEFRIIRPDGTIHWIHHDCQPVFGDQGQFLGIRGSNRDVTVRKLTQEALLKSEKRLAAIFDFLPDATWAINKESRVIAWNKACQELTGVSADKVMGKGDYCYSIPFYGSPRPMLIDFALEPSSARELLDPYLNGYTNFSIENGNITAESSGLLLAEGRYLWWKATRLYDSDGQVAGAIESVRDITELRLAKEAAIASSRAKSAFLATMSHELRTPLNAIIGFSDLIRIKGCGEINDSQEEYLGYILDSSKHLLALINDILDLSKVESGKMELTLSKVDIHRVITGSLNIIKKYAEQQGIAIYYTLDEHLPKVIRGDELKIKQILFNLLSNAVKFTPNGGSVTVSTGTVTAESVQSPPHNQELPVGNYLLLSVTDTGIGIKKEDIHRIFEPFEQSDNSSTRQHEGTGLGLSLSKMLAQLHGGTIWATPNPEGVGSVFYLTIPINQQARYNKSLTKCKGSNQ